MIRILLLPQPFIVHPVATNRKIHDQRITGNGIKYEY